MLFGVLAHWPAKHLCFIRKLRQIPLKMNKKSKQNFILLRGFSQNIIVFLTDNL